MTQKKDVFEVAKQIPIMEVISYYGITAKKKGGVNYILCPFHGDKKIGSCKVFPNLNGFKCWSCGASGDVISLVSKMENCSTLDAAKKLSEGRLGNIDPIKLAKKAPKASSERKKRNPEHLEKVYRAFVRACPPLSEKHVKHLKEVRKVSDLSCFFEFPKDTPEFWKSFKRELKRENLKGSLMGILDRVPGFYFDMKTDDMAFVSYKGIGIILYDCRGKITGLQIRKDVVKEDDSRYKLFSSGFAAYNGEEDELINGASIGQVLDVSFPNVDEGVGGIAITEGKFKGLTLAKRGFLTLSLNGVNSQNVVDQFLQFASHYSDRCMIVFDADIIEKASVRKAGKELAKRIKQNDMSAYFLTWDKEIGKGIDDFFNNGGKQLHIASASKFFKKSSD